MKKNENGSDTPFWELIPTRQDTHGRWEYSISGPYEGFTVVPFHRRLIKDIAEVLCPSNVRKTLIGRRDDNVVRQTFPLGKGRP